MKKTIGKQMKEIELLDHFAGVAMMHLLDKQVFSSGDIEDDLTIIFATKKAYHVAYEMLQVRRDFMKDFEEAESTL